MRRLFIFLFLALMSLNSYAQTNVQTMVNQTVKPFLAAQGIRGAAIGVYYQGQTYYFNYGYADKNNKVPVTNNTIFDLASITKIFTTTLLATQMQENKIKLTDPIVKYLPSLANTQNLPVDNVTVLDLATHTAGLPRDVTALGTNKGDKPGLMTSLKTWTPNEIMGSAYLYSNISFGLLGLVLEGASGQSYVALLKKEITDPLHMSHTVVDVPQKLLIYRAQGYNRRGLPAKLFVSTYLIGGGSLRSSATDMMAFLKANLQISSNSQSSALLKAMQLAQQPHYTVKPNFVMALGWQRMTRDGHLYITKNGSNIGFSSFIGFSPDRKFGVVILANRSSSKAGALGWKLLTQLK